jgi:ABC-type amino acid transport substrate-binding protein
MRKIKIIVFGNDQPFSTYDPVTKKYNGLFFNIWNKISKNLNYEFEYSISSNDQNEENLMAMVQKNEYDMAVGRFTVTNKSLTKVNFSRPLHIGSWYVYKKNKDSFFGIIFNKTSLIILSIVIVLFFVFITWYAISTQNKFIESFYVIWVNLFTNNSISFPKQKKTGSDIFFNISFTFFSFLFSVYIVTTIVNGLINKKTFIPVKDLNLKTIHIVKNSGDDYLAHLEKFKEIKMVDSDEKLVHLAQTIDNTYILVLQDYVEYFAHNLNSLMSTEKPLFVEESGFIVNFNHTELLKEINLEIVKLQDEGWIENECKKFLKHPNACLL